MNAYRILSEKTWEHNMMLTFFAPRIFLKRIHLAIILLTSFLLSFPPNSHASAPTQESVNILVLDSYYPSMPWSQEFYKGLVEAQESSNQNINIFIEYLDKSRILDGINSPELYKYQTKNINILPSLELSPTQISPQISLKNMEMPL